MVNSNLSYHKCLHIPVFRIFSTKKIIRGKIAQKGVVATESDYSDDVLRAAHSFMGSYRFCKVCVLLYEKVDLENRCRHEQVLFQ